MERTYSVDGNAMILAFEPNGAGARVRAGDETIDVESFAVGERFVTLRMDGVTYRLAYHRDGQRLRVAYRGRTFELVPADVEDDRDDAAGAFTPEVTSPMPGKVLEVLVAEGEEVEADAALFLLEAMKMEQTMRAGAAATIAEIHVTAGDMVGPGQVLAVLAPRADEDG